MGRGGSTMCRPIQQGQTRCCSVSDLLSRRTGETMGRGRRVYLATGSKAMETFVQIVFPIVQSF